MQIFKKIGGGDDSPSDLQEKDISELVEAAEKAKALLAKAEEAKRQTTIDKKREQEKARRASLRSSCCGCCRY